MLSESIAKRRRSELRWQKSTLKLVKVCRYDILVKKSVHRSSLTIAEYDRIPATDFVRQSEAKSAASESSTPARTVRTVRYRVINMQLEIICEDVRSLGGI